MEDKEFILESARRLERWENTPRPVSEDYADMNRNELIKLAIYQREHMEEMEAARKFLEYIGKLYGWKRGTLS